MNKYWRKWYLKNRERLLKKAKDNRAANRERVKAYNAAYRLLNPEKVKKANKKWLLENTDKWSSSAAAWRAANKDKRCATEARRKARKLHATPAWANEFFINEIYALAALRTKLIGKRFEVDHVVPLSSPIVCGLHWEGNLRVIPAVENHKKHNNTWPDMPEANHG